MTNSKTLRNVNPAPLAARIRDLRSEAASAGDEAQVDLCDLALRGDALALTECIHILEAAEG